jgi:hypothetical protein
MRGVDVIGCTRLRVYADGKDVIMGDEWVPPDVAGEVMELLK